MRKVGLRLMSWLAMVILPVQLLAAESSDAAVIVADSRKFTGWRHDGPTFTTKVTSGLR